MIKDIKRCAGRRRRRDVADTRRRNYTRIMIIGGVSNLVLPTPTARPVCDGSSAASGSVRFSLDTVSLMCGGDQPDLDEIEAWFAGVVEGRVGRDAADRWAGRWYGDHDLEWDDLSWWALGLLYGIDLRPGPEEPYLHDDEQVLGWLEELRRRRAG